MRNILLGTALLYDTYRLPSLVVSHHQI